MEGTPEGMDIGLPSYESPRAVPLAMDKDKKKPPGCKHGNQITGDCTTGGYPEGNMADCRNGVSADQNATCDKGKNPGVT